MDVMSTAKALGILLAVGFLSQPVSAFQETGGKAAAPAAAPSMDLSVPGVQSKSSGPEIRVPGLGTIGALPKLDFGLELLYGASEPKGARDEKLADPSDLQIRGTVKYKFGN
jgi:hypothetical protein